MVMIPRGPMNLHKRLKMGAQPAIGAGMMGQAPVTNPGPMPMMKKGGAVKKKHHEHKEKKMHKAKGGHVKCDYSGGGIHTTPTAKHKNNEDHISGTHHMAKGGHVKKKHHEHNHMKSEGVHKMHHGHKPKK